MFEIEVKDAFKITGRGYVIAGEVIDNKTALRIGDTLIHKDDLEQKLNVKGIEMINYRPGQRINLNHIGLLVDITEDAAKSLIGKRLFKH